MSLATPPRVFGVSIPARHSKYSSYHVTTRHRVGLSNLGKLPGFAQGPAKEFANGALDKLDAHF